MVGTLIPGVVNGEGDRTRTVSVVGRDNSDNGITDNILRKSLYVTEDLKSRRSRYKHKALNR